MCPSYKVTLEEQHSTRGRARLLFEMIEGEVLEDRWRSDAVHEALDLCLSCKGCKSDCPVNVDMATYKAEFLDKYYRGRLRPRPAYSMGMIDVWAQLASHVPHVANFFTQTPGLAAASKAVAGLAQQRQLPPFAPQTFRDWFRRRRPGRVDGREVLLWPDTFNNYFPPETAAAAVETLEDAGYRVRIPRPVLCCGRPLYDFGFLDRAKRLLSNVVTALAPDIRRGLPLVGLEPSCVAVFRDELQELFPNHNDAQRLTKQTRTLGEFLADVDYKPPKLRGRALVHGHCHQKPVVGMSGETKTLDRTGLDYKVLDSGCCGMAGSFGFEAEKYGVSQDVGELALLPAVRKAPLDAAIVADGFSCRTQIEQATGRRAVHLAELLRLASRGSGDGFLPFYPEDRVGRVMPGGPTRVEKGLLALGSAALGVAAAGLLRRMR